MKRKILALIFFLVLCLLGCAKQNFCQLCGENFGGKPNEYEANGQTYILCDKCYEPFEGLK